MVRGVNKSALFLDDEDRKYFIYVLMKVKKVSNFILYAYCLMDNHVHLLIVEDEEPLAMIMKRINVRYARYFNKKYTRVGHLCQGRYRSEAIESDRYLLACVRYIHNNPCKAGIVTHPEEFPWSSYRAYLQTIKHTDMVNIDFILGYFGNSRTDSEMEFISFSEQIDDNEDFLDIEEEKEELLSRANAVIKAVLDKHNLTLDELRSKCSPPFRNGILREIRQNVNISAQELSELLDISVHLIYRS
jgi:REP element-mobilizing transposase RayT/DNA-binding transcriptional regulator YiaG